MKNDNLKEQYRINERIRVREVRLVGDNIETGVYPIAQALQNSGRAGDGSSRDFTKCCAPRL